METIVRYYFMPTRMAGIKTPTISSFCVDVEKLELSYVAGENINQFSYCGKEFVPQTELSHDPEIPLLGIHAKQLKIGTQINIYTRVHSSTIFNRQIMETAQILISG